MTKSIFGLFLIIGGLAATVYALYLINLRNLPLREVNADELLQLEEVQPVTISINSVGINAPIAAANIVNGKWPALTDAVMYWSESPLPGNVGNSVLYGHNWPNLFADLVKVKRGDTIEIKLSDGSIRNFTVIDTSTITPDQTHILEATQDQRLTIYTCSGFLDSKRFVVVATPK